MVMVALLWIGATGAAAQAFDVDPVFSVELQADRQPLVAGDVAQLAVVLRVDPGWHVNSDDPGDDFSVPTTLEWTLPEGWDTPIMSFPEGRNTTFEFSDQPLEVWHDRVIMVGGVTVPKTAKGAVDLAVAVTAQACNNTQCLPPLPVIARLSVDVAPAGTTSRPVHPELFAGSSAGDAEHELGDKALPLLLLLVFFGGLALNLTPCVFPLIPITVGFFTQQTKDRNTSAFPLALAYVIGIALTYSALGVAAALSGGLFGSALQSPWVVGGIVVVLLALASSMFGLWEIGVPGWAQRASGGRGGVVGALLMGLVMGFVAAPCIGPFVLGLVTLVGQKGDPVFGFIVFFVLSLGLGLPYLVLGTFTGLLNRLPASGMWMIGIRKLLGVILVAMAAYFAAPQLPATVGPWLIPGVLILGALYLLIVDRTAHDQPAIDRMVRLVCAAMLVSGALLAPPVGSTTGQATMASGSSAALEWQPYSQPALQAAIDTGGPVIVDFYADWCVPCKELDEKTFNDPKVRPVLEDFARFKVDLTKSSDTTQELTAAYGVRGVPTVVVYSAGREAFRITGFEPARDFLQRLEALR